MRFRIYFSYPRVSPFPIATHIIYNAMLKCRTCKEVVEKLWASAGDTVLRSRSVILVFFAVFFTAILTPNLYAAEARQLAFPEAEGFGRFTQGGRGGQAYIVTTLDDYHPGDAPISGSLRKGIEDTTGPRTIIFNIGGTISLVDNLTLSNGHITIAGQTAPGGGITLVNGSLIIEAGEVILRHIRVRLIRKDIALDSIRVAADKRYAKLDNVIIDHCSFSWGGDETFNIGGFSNMTIQRSIISEGMLFRDLNGTGSAGKGLLISWGATNITVHHNLLAHNWRRNPYVESGDVDFVNNLIYNFGIGLHVNTIDGVVRINVVNNYFKQGPNSERLTAIRLYGIDGQESNPDYLDQSRIYASGNIDTTFRPSLSEPESELIYQGLPGKSWEGKFSNIRFNYPLVITSSAAQAYNDVLEDVGANIPVSDKIDSRILVEVEKGTGKHPDTLADIGEGAFLGKIVRASDYDKDHDGMPDVWEFKYGFDPKDSSDGVKDANGDGYSNLEGFLNSVSFGSPQSSSPPAPPPGVEAVSEPNN